MSGINQKDVLLRANKKLSLALLGFLGLIPLVVIVYHMGILPYSFNEMMVVCGCVLFFSVVPFVVNKFCYNEHIISSCNLYCLELLLLMLACNPILDLSLLYFILPIVSLIYLNRNILHKMSMVAFVGMILVKGSKLGYFVYSGNKPADGWNTLYMDILVSTVEYIVMAIILIKTFEIMEDIFSKVTHTAMVEMYNSSEQSVAVQSPNLGMQPQRNAEHSDTYDVQQFFSAIAVDMENLIKGKNKHFTLDLDNQMPVELYGRKAQLKSALTNICADLLMYNSESEVNVYVTYENGINLRKKDNITMIIRIDSNTILNKTAADKKALGYYLSKKIIGELEGDLTEINENGKTNFKIRLLQRVENDQTIEERQNKQKSEILELKQSAIANKAQEKNNRLFHSDVHVMVVDDNREVRKLVDSVLSAVGVKVTGVKNGVECIEMLKTQDYDMVLIDQMMPGKSGIETVKEIRFQDSEYFQKLPIVMMSIHGGSEECKNCQTQGFTDCISKPIKVNEIKSCLKKWIKDDYRMSYEEYMRIQNES
ncbi:MAG: response regulator [Lachnospiraceae bacterium]|nr:response regulator [Lachnospiraceae bacterium]